MSKGQYITYRIIGAVMTLLAYFFFFMALAVAFNLGFHADLLLGLFVSGCMVIYTNLSRLFVHIVVKEQRPIRRTLKDWIIVNALVVIGGLGYDIFRMWLQALNKALSEETLGILNKAAADAGSVAGPITHDMLVEISVFLSVIIGIGIVHAVWTLLLVKRFKASFQ